MKKFNFQDLPNTDTPIKASTLNTMQSNIEESCVAVSPTQPETNEKVWIQKGKNLFDGLNEIGDIDTETGLNVNSSNFVRTVNSAKVKPQTTYTFKIDRVSNQIVVYYYNYNTFLNFEFTSNTDTYIFTTPENCNSVRFRISTPILLEQGQLEQGSTATEYEPYVEPKILCKNDNGVYEEFYKKISTNIISCKVSKNITNTEVNVMPLNAPLTVKFQIGNGFELVNGNAIKVGKGIKYVKISGNTECISNVVNARASIQPKVNETYIGSNVFAFPTMQNYGMGFASILVSVTEGDLIYLNIYLQKGITINSDFTNFTVEAVV